MATLGIAEAALPVIEEATVKLIEFTELELEQYLIGEIVNAALQPVMGMAAHAETVAGHAEKCTANVGALDFSS